MNTSWRDPKTDPLRKTLPIAEALDKARAYFCFTLTV
jgi:hypothetical protein